MVKFLDLNAQYKSIKREMDLAISSVIEESAFIGGKFVKSFEGEFSQYVASKFAVGVGNGTDALEIALEALDLPKGSEVIVPANSFIASSEAVSRSGLKVVFCDCDPDNYTISIDSMVEMITKNTSAVIAVHLYGHPCEMDAILSVASQHSLKVIEDCAQAHGAEYKGRRVGSIGDVGTFSFYPGKNLGAYGDGGAITTNDKVLAEKARMIANHGRKEKYDHVFEGRNSRLDGLQAKVLSVKLNHIEEWTNRRIQIADRYLRELKDIASITLPLREDYVRQVYHLFVIRVENRDELKQFLADKEVQSGVHYPIALPKLEAYDYISQNTQALAACQFDSNLLSLPIGEHLSDSDVAKVIDVLKVFYSN